MPPVPSKETTPPDPPRRRPTIKDIAAEAGVSKGLVSLILNGAPGPSADSAARVIAIADRLGYRANRAASLLARRRSRMLGVTTNPNSPFHAELVEHIQRVATEHGYEIALGAVTPAHPERTAVEALLDLRSEALLLLGSELSPTQLTDLTAHVPTVSVGRPVDLPQIDVVRAADRHGIGLAVDHLVALGHRYIAHVDGGRSYIAKERRDGYRAAIRRHHLQPMVIPGGDVEADGMRAATQLMHYREVTAVVSFNDRSAVGVIEHLERSGLRVPDDMSVTGFDNSVLAQLLRISLTTVSQEAKEQAELAVATVISRLDHRDAARVEHVLTPQLMIRNTTLLRLPSNDEPGPADHDR